MTVTDAALSQPAEIGPAAEAEPSSPPPGVVGANVLDGYAVDSQVGFLLRRAYQRHAALFQDAFAEHDLTPMQFTALVRTVELGRTTQNLLGRMAAMDPATVQGVVRRLIARGLIRRMVDPMDRRTVVLAPTQAGAELASRLVSCARRITEATMAPLDEHERGTLLSLLRKIA